jgi:amino acid transporter
VFFALLFTGLNLRSIKATARTNEILALAMLAVVGWMLAATVRLLAAMPTLDASYFLRPFYDPKTFSISSISTGTSIAVLTYIGFDAISTLSEEVENPRRNILLGTVLTCLLTGVLAAIEVYAGQLVWPWGDAFPDLDTAYVHVAGRAGGVWLFHAVNLTLLVATIGSGSGAQLAGARLLYGMGRDGALPTKVFGMVDVKTGVPRNNVLITGAIALVGAFLLSYQRGVELLNFGAFIGFMGVNLSALARYWIRSPQRNLSNLLPPLAGFVLCLYIWLSLPAASRLGGAAWLLLGLAYGAWTTGGFRRERVRFDVPQD